MKVPQESDMGGAHSVYDLWTSNMTLNPDASNVMAIQSGIPFKSRDVLNWDNKSISLVSVTHFIPLRQDSFAGIFRVGTNLALWFSRQANYSCQ